MDKSTLRVIIVTIWLASLLVLITALTALAKTLGSKPAESIHQHASEVVPGDAGSLQERALKLIEARTQTDSKEKNYVKLSTDKEALKQKLSSEAYDVCFNAGTEAPFTGKYWNNHEAGMYTCVVCGTPLFSSQTKFNSGTGWPSFYNAVNDGAIELVEDDSHGMKRTEVRCATCGAHLGHIFNDGPPPTGLRYCINSVALEFKPDKAEKAEEQK